MVGITMCNDALPTKEKPFKVFSQVYPEGDTMLYLLSTCVVVPSETYVLNKTDTFTSDSARFTLITGQALFSDHGAFLPNPFTPKTKLLLLKQMEK